MIDIHVHLLPGVDDGPADGAEAVAMCALAAADGIQVAVTTPHQRHELWGNEDAAALEAARQELEAASGGRPRLLLGAEIRVDSQLLDEVDRASGRSLLSLAGSRYLLLEFPALPLLAQPRDVVRELALSGWRPIVAHPERIPWLAEAPGLLAALVEEGALLQLTGASITGGMGRRAAACCEWLLDEGLVHFVASDGHDPTSRPPCLSATYRAVAEGWGEEMAHRLMCENPRRVTMDEPLDGGG